MTWTWKLTCGLCGLKEQDLPAPETGLTGMQVHLREHLRADDPSLTDDEWRDRLRRTLHQVAPDGSHEYVLADDERIWLVARKERTR